MGKRTDSIWGFLVCLLALVAAGAVGRAIGGLAGFLVALGVFLALLTLLTFVGAIVRSAARSRK